ncbi:hypothetical protein ABIC83_002515 [Roseateles asaccharophilus]|uniref:hypothetical protein n=1 Tax=Roseateles asaccharophilus TaxID=582607 RepID=UPI0038332BE2
MAHIRFPVVAPRTERHSCGQTSSWATALSEGQAACERLDVNRGRLRFRELLALIYPDYTPSELARSACNRHADYLFEEAIEIEDESFENRHLRDTAMDCIAALPPAEALELVKEFQSTLIAFDLDSVTEWEAEFMRKGGVANGDWVASLFSDGNFRRGEQTDWVSEGEVSRRTSDAIERMTACGFRGSRQDSALWLYEHVAFAHNVPVAGAIAFLQTLRSDGVVPQMPLDGSRKAELALTFTLRSIAADWAAAAVSVQMNQAIDIAVAGHGHPALKPRTPRMV